MDYAGDGPWQVVRRRPVRIAEVSQLPRCACRTEAQLFQLSRTGKQIAQSRFLRSTLLTSKFPGVGSAAHMVKQWQVGGVAHVSDCTVRYGLGDLRRCPWDQ